VDGFFVVRQRSSSRREVACLVTDEVDDLVYQDGADAVSRTDPLDGAKMPAVGIIIQKISDTRAVVQYDGEVATTGLSPGARYFVGAAGTPATSPPAGPARRYAQEIGVALNATTLLLRVHKPTIMVG